MRSVSYLVQPVKLKEKLLYFFIFIPYLTVFTKSIDTAPYALLFSTVVFLLIKKKTFPYELWILFFLFLAAALVLSINGLNFTISRILAGYFSIFVIAASTYFILKRNKEVNNKLIYGFFIFWFTVGLFQALVYPEFLTSFIVRSSTTLERGVTGLAPEPTYYASVMIFFMIVSYINNYKFLQTLVLGIVSIVFLSKSSTGVLILFSFFALYFSIFILNKKMFYTFVLASFILTIAFINFDFFQGTRLYKLTNLLFENPIMMFVIDASGNARIWNIVGGFLGSFDNYLLPNPNNNFQESLLHNMQLHSDYVHPYTISIATNKIMSGTGQMFFNLGAMSLLYFYALFSLSYKYFKSIKKAIFLTFCLFSLMTTAIPLTFPIFGFIYGLLAYKAYKEPYENLSLNRKP